MSIKGISDKELFDRLIGYLFENIAQGGMDVNSIATALALSPSQLNRRVKASTGLTTSAFVVNCRLDMAKRLLADYPTVTMKEVAYRCGFSDAAHFSHVFRKHEGISPSQYAQSHSFNPIDLASFIHRQVANEATKNIRRRTRHENPTG
mgnify:CR=1 FL=1